MRIAFIGQNQIPAASGNVDKHVEEIASVMAQGGHEVFAYVQNKDAAKNLIVHRSVRLIHLPDLSIKFLNNFFATAHALFCGFDTVNFQGGEAANFAWLTKIFRPGAKVVTTFFQQNSARKTNGFFACNFSDKVIVFNKVTRLALRKKYGVKPIVIPEGSDEKQTKNIEAISGLGLKSKKYVLTAGKLCKSSQLHHLIEVFKKLEDTGKTTNNFKLVVLGKDLIDDEYEKYLKVLAQGRKNIIIVENENERISQQLFSHAYLFIEPSIVGSTKSIILEAQSYGLATLVSDVKKNMAVIKENGFSFEASDSQSLQARLAFLLSRPSEVEKMSVQTKQKFENQFGWRAVSEKTFEVFDLCHRESDSRVSLSEFAGSSRK